MVRAVARASSSWGDLLGHFLAKIRTYRNAEYTALNPFALFRLAEGDLTQYAIARLCRRELLLGFDRKQLTEDVSSMLLAQFVVPDIESAHKASLAVSTATSERAKYLWASLRNLIDSDRCWKAWNECRPTSLGGGDCEAVLNAADGVVIVDRGACSDPLDALLTLESNAANGADHMVERVRHLLTKNNYLLLRMRAVERMSPDDIGDCLGVKRDSVVRSLHRLQGRLADLQLGDQ